MRSSLQIPITKTATPATADAGKPDAKAIFMADCASCHNPIKDAVGPALQGALARWDDDRNGIKSFYS